MSCINESLALLRANIIIAGISAYLKLGILTPFARYADNCISQALINNVNKPKVIKFIGSEIRSSNGFKNNDIVARSKPAQSTAAIEDKVMAGKSKLAIYKPKALVNVMRI
ncbi:hypothetical protein N752_07745 [Desulforamulus aquiferis]|nr:hypothetical protein N752_07745 [Desulforamulus aquiferis]